MNGRVILFFFFLSLISVAVFLLIVFMWRWSCPMKDAVKRVEDREYNGWERFWKRIR